MTTFTISGHTGFFHEGTPGPDTLIVKRHGSIVVDAGPAATLSASDPWTVKIDGLVQTTANIYAILLPFDNSSSGKFTIGATGKVSGGEYGIFSSSPTSITNHGTITGGTLALDLSDRKDTVVNTGKLIGGIFAGDGEDLVVNFQKVGHTIKSGTITGIIDLGRDNDTFQGGNKAETVRDAPGLDHYSLGGGNDTYLAVSVVTGLEPDSVNGGKGIDTYSMSGSSLALAINLDSIIRFGVGPGFAALSDGSVDETTNFENVFGGSGNDTIVGSKGANGLNGGDGGDLLIGLGSRDVLSGGGGADIFSFVKLSDSGVTAKTRDVITDFTHGLDHIDFDDLEHSLNRTFTFIEQQKFHHHGNAEFRDSFNHGNTLVSLDANGDGKADLTILLKGLHTLDSDDFFF